MDNQKEVTTVRVTERRTASRVSRLTASLKSNFQEYFELQPFTLKLNWQINCLTGKWNIYINFDEWIERLITVCSGDFSFFSESNCKKNSWIECGNVFTKRNTCKRAKEKIFKWKLTTFLEFDVMWNLKLDCSSITCQFS